jgi:hypothetical protein
MLKEILQDDRDKLFLSLNRHVSGLSKRGISFVINAHSEFVGSIDITVTGKKGTVTQNIIVIYNQNTLSWEAYCEGNKYLLVALNEILVLCKNLIVSLSVLATKI